MLKLLVPVNLYTQTRTEAEYDEMLIAAKYRYVGLLMIVAYTLGLRYWKYTIMKTGLSNSICQPPGQRPSY